MMAWSMASTLMPDSKRIGRVEPPMRTSSEIFIVDEAFDVRGTKETLHAVLKEQFRVGDISCRDSTCNPPLSYIPLGQAVCLWAQWSEECADLDAIWLSGFCRLDRGRLVIAMWTYIATPEYPQT